MIHGKTKIELYNPKTKVKEIIRSENTFQGQNIANYMKTMGCFGSNSILTDTTTGVAPKNRPFWQTYVGGILLFRDSIPANSKFMPSTNRMVGNGSYGVVNAEDVPEMGSYNITESSASLDDGITMIYDFNTAQANGTISSICLTSETGGYIGYGNLSGKRKTSLFPLNRYEENSTINFSGSTFPSLATIGTSCYPVIRNNIAYAAVYNNTNKQLTIYKAHIPVTTGHIFDLLGWETVTIDCTSMHVVNSDICLSSCANGKIYLINTHGSNYSVNSTIYYWEYDPSDDSLVEKSFVNTSSHSIPVGCIHFAYGKIICTYNIESYTAYCSIFDITTGEMDVDTLYVGYTGTSSQNIECGEFGNGMIFLGLKNNHGLVLYDLQLKQIYLTNGSISDSYSLGGGLNYDLDMNVISGNSNKATGVFNHPLYLATINNLQSPITKDNSHTMKITYTLTEA